MLKTFYIASSIVNKDAVQSLIKTLTNEGYECSFDWTQNIINDLSDLAEREAQLNKELDAIRTTDFVVALPRLGRGAHGELFGALVLNKPVFYLGEYDSSCLMYDALYYASSEKDLLQLISLHQNWIRIK